MNDARNREQAAIAALEELMEDSPATEPSEPQAKHTLLKMWRDVLGNIEASAEAPTAMQDAIRITAEWPQLKVQDLPAYHKVLYAKLIQFRTLLDDEIASDPKALKNIEEDAKDNSEHYLNLLIQWQLQAMQWEVTWDAKDSDSHIQLAGHVDAVKMILGPQGLVAHLDQIGFELHPEDEKSMNEALMDAAESLASTAAEPK